MRETPARPRRIAGLDGLRALAAVLVVLFHAASGLPITAPVITQIAGVGWVGVDVFFTISGFILFLPFARAARGGRPVRLRAFAVSRLRRILPAYWFNLVVTILFTAGALLGTATGWKTIAANFLFVSSYLQLRTVNGAAWTLFAEMVFYAVLPLLAFLFVRWRWTVGLPIVLCISMGYKYWAIHGRVGADGVLSPAQRGVVVGLLDYAPSVIDEFAIGMVAAAVWVAFERRGVVLGRLVSLLTALLGAGLAVFVLWLLMGPLGADRYWDGSSRFGFLPLMTFKPLLALGAALFVFGLCYRSNPLTWLFDLRPVRYLGVLSYGIYLWHLAMLNVILPLARPEWGVNREYGMRVIATLVLAVAFAALSFHFIEKRFLSVASLRLRDLDRRVPIENEIAP